MSFNYRNLFDNSIDNALKSSLQLVAEFPKSSLALLKIAKNESKAKKIRDKWLEKDVSIPPLLIISTTENCNLHCKGCYAMANCHEQSQEMTEPQIKDLLNQVSEAGCSTILLAGGEPLLAKNWCNSLAEHKELLGLVFTNGTLFNEEWYKFFAKNRNLIPLFSVEGISERTDNRRGVGVTEKIKKAMDELHNLKVPFGISITTGQHNIDEVLTDEFVKPYVALGCRLVVHVEYVPMGKESEFAPLSVESKMYLAEYCDAKKDNNVLYIVFPGNEEAFDGCLAAGRGFVHISSSGSLEACPFAPYSDRNVLQMSFIEAMKSPLLKALRAESNVMHEGIGGCSLRKKEAWIQGIIQNTNRS